MKIKICGLTRDEDAKLAVELGAWALGFIFYPKSVRHVTPARAAALIAALPAGHKAQTVGVFVDAKADEVETAVKTAGLSIIQLHGNETPEFCAGLAARLGRPVYKAVRPAAAPDLAKASAYKSVSALLVDAAVPGEFGGTGKTANWNLAREMKRFGLVVLAGGLTPDNIESAISAVQPFAVDVSSGVEASPGVKDHARLRRLFEVIGDTT